MVGLCDSDHLDHLSRKHTAARPILARIESQDLFLRGVVRSREVMRCSQPEMLCELFDVVVPEIADGVRRTLPLGDPASNELPPETFVHTDRFISGRSLRQYEIVLAVGSALR